MKCERERGRRAERERGAQERLGIKCERKRDMHIKGEKRGEACRRGE